MVSKTLLFFVYYALMLRVALLIQALFWRRQKVSIKTPFAVNGEFFIRSVKKYLNKRYP